MPYQKNFFVSTAFLLASGKSSNNATVIIIPATKASIFSRESIASFSSSTPHKNRRATNAPAGSANPLTLASTKAKRGLSGRAARQGTAIAIPSGMLWIMIPIVTVIPRLWDSRADAATASPSGKLCTSKLTNKSIATRQAFRWSLF